MELLVSAMNIKNEKAFIKKMNIRTNAIIINQTDNVGYRKIINDGNLIEIYNFKEKGVGLSRNSALMRAKEEIVLIADEDMVYNNDYDKIVENAFKSKPDADIIIFNVESMNKERPMYKITKNEKINHFNYLKYGASRLAIRTDSIRKNNIYFSLLFGGGCKYQSGEDSIFIRQCLKSKMNIYTNTNFIGKVEQTTSTWFKGYDEQYFKDKGALYASMFPKFTNVFIL